MSTDSTPGQFTYDLGSQMDRIEGVVWRPTCYPWITYDAVPQEAEGDKPHIVIASPSVDERPDRGG